MNSLNINKPFDGGTAKLYWPMELIEQASDIHDAVVGDAAVTQAMVNTMTSIVLMSAGRTFLDYCSSVLMRCQSPIEQLLAIGFLAVAHTDNAPLNFHLEPCPGDECPPSTAPGQRFLCSLDEFVVTPQFQIGDYRVDFLVKTCMDIRDDLKYTASVVVECDGHDFHERTKQQAAHDRKRDRFIQSKGYKVLRFTGSEIWANSFACAKEVMKHLTDDTNGQYVAAGCP